MDQRYKLRQEYDEACFHVANIYTGETLKKMLDTFWKIYNDKLLALQNSKATLDPSLIKQTE